MWYRNQDSSYASHKDGGNRLKPFGFWRNAEFSQILILFEALASSKVSDVIWQYYVKPMENIKRITNKLMKVFRWAHPCISS